MRLARPKPVRSIASALANYLRLVIAKRLRIRLQRFVIAEGDYLV
jgi:hypothetical protein